MSGGILRDEVAVQLINNSHHTFQQCLEEAIKLDASYRAREVLKDGDRVAVSILKTEYERQPDTYNNVNTVEPVPNYPDYQAPVPSDVVGYRGYERGQYSQDGTNVQLTRPQSQTQNQPFYCRYCGKAWHYAKNCRQRLRDERQRSRGYQGGYGNQNINRDINQYQNSYPQQNYNRNRQNPTYPSSTTRNRSVAGNNPLNSDQRQGYKEATERQTNRQNPWMSPSAHLLEQRTNLARSNTTEQDNSRYSNNQQTASGHASSSNY